MLGLFFPLNLSFYVVLLVNSLMVILCRTLDKLPISTVKAMNVIS